MADHRVGDQDGKNGQDLPADDNIQRRHEVVGVNALAEAAQTTFSLQSREAGTGGGVSPLGREQGHVTRMHGSSEIADQVSLE